MNPEFQRNLYLEFSIARLVGMPVFLLVIFSLSYLIDDRSFNEATANTAIGLFICIVLLWGAKQAAESILDEMRNNTWDIQVTSTIAPWSLAWGKLFGSTIFCWYGGVLSLMVYSLATPEPEYITLTWIYALSCGVLTQSLGMLVSLFSLRRKQVYSGSIYLLALLSLIFIVPLLFNIDDFYHQTISWYRQQYNLSYFIAISLILAGGWAVTGIYRLLTEALRIRTLPWVWLSFTVFLIIYFTGMITEDHEYKEIGMVMNLTAFSFVIFVISSYLLLFIDKNSPMVARKLLIYSHQAQWLRVLQEMPCWSVSVVLALPSMVILTLLYPIDKIEEYNFYPLVIYLLLLRDIGIVLFFSYADNPKRALGLSLLYMVCLYGLLPAIFNSMDAEVVSGIILPVLNNNLLLAILFASIQTALIGFLLFQRWCRRGLVSGALEPSR